MPAKNAMPTPEEYAAHRRRYARLIKSTNATLTAGLEGLERGDPKPEIARAMAAARARFSGRRAGTPEGAAPPRLAGEGWGAEQQRAFLVHLAQTGCVSHACERVGLSRQSAYALRRRAPSSVFAIGWDVAIYMAQQALLDEATERAFAGREVPVWYHGEQVGTRIVHNDRLLMFLLGRREPLHPRLDAREMTHLFPTMLNMVDTILPALGADRIAELTGDGEPDHDPGYDVDDDDDDVDDGGPIFGTDADRGLDDDAGGDFDADA